MIGERMEPTMLKQMGARIKEKRKEAHLSQAKLAELTGYSDKTAISKIELGKIDLPQSKLMLIANVLNTTPSYLLDGDREKLNPYIQELVLTASKCDLEDIQMATEMLKRVAELKGR